MTSPGGNLVEIRVIARDMTGPGFDAATRQAKGLAAAVAGGSGSAAGAMKEAERQASGLGGTLRRVGEVAGGVLVAGVVQQMSQRALQLVRSTAQAASGLNESLNAVSKTFEGSAGEITDWGKANANALGMSQRAFNQSATVLGAMLKNQGLAMDEVTDHTTKLAERAADMASVFNTDVSDALAAIQAGLRGEIDPLERYGVSLSAATVEQRALADTGKTAASELTAQDKALARLAVLYEQTDDVAGDFRDTSDGMANAQRIATAQIEDAKAKIGTAFMPVLAKASQLTGEFAEKFASIPGPLQLVVIGVLGVGAAIGLLGPKVLAAKASLDAMAASDSRVQRGMARTAIAIGKATAALAAVAIAGQAVSAAFGSDATTDVDAYAKSLERFAATGVATGEAARMFGENMDLLNYDLAGFDSATLNQISEGLAGFAEAIAGSGPGEKNLEKSNQRIRALDQALAQLVSSGNAEAAAKVFERLVVMAGEKGIGRQDIIDGLVEYQRALEGAGEKTTEVGTAAEEAARGVDELNTEFDELIDTAFGFEEAQDAAADALARLTEQIKRQKDANEEGAGALVGNTQAARDNRDSVRDLVQQYKDLIVEAQESGHSTVGLRQELEDQLVKMGFARDEAKRYTDVLLGLEEQLAKIQSKDVYVNAIITETRQKARGFASGGISGAAGGGPRGSRTLVGEQGPELVDLPFGSTVHSAGDSMRLAQEAQAPSAQGPLEMTFHGDVDSAFATAFMKLIRTGQITIAAKAIQ